MVELNYVQEPIKSSFCEADEAVKVAYSDLMTSSKETLDSILELQQVGFLSENLNKKNEIFFSYLYHICFRGQDLFMLDVSFLYFTNFHEVIYLYKIIYITTDFIVTVFVFAPGSLC